MPINYQAGVRKWVDIVASISGWIRHYDPPYLQHGDVRHKHYAGADQPWNGNRPQWFKGVRAGIYRHGRRYVSEDHFTATHCDGCGWLVSVQGFQIDHMAPWLLYLQQYADGWLTNLEARILYNDPGNLRLLCSICNGSHPEIYGPAANTRGAYLNNAQSHVRFLVGDENIPDV